MHGSCVLSKAVGSMNGVFKGRARVIVLKITEDQFDVYWAFNEVWSFAKQRSTDPIVVLFPWASGPNDRDEDFPWIRVKPTIQDIFAEGVSIVVASGNEARDPDRQLVDSMPARWAAPSFPLIVAGAVDNLGSRAIFSQRGDLLTTWAPGLNVACAGSLGIDSGTSFSAGMVSILERDVHRYCTDETFRSEVFWRISTLWMKSGRSKG